VASWIDNFKIPLKEIKAKYTKSDLTLIAWDSRLRNYNMSLGFKEARTSRSDGAVGSAFVPRVPQRAPVPKADDYISPAGVRETDTAYILPEGVNNGMPIPKDAFDEEGEIDLRKLPGPKAAQYLRGLGIPMAVVLPDPGRRKQ
jgi:hypothetical protein